METKCGMREDDEMNNEAKFFFVKTHIKVITMISVVKGIMAVF
jgi:hypothetical protein